jgi:phosphatidylethanolamine/phosphatidyl-N-methylethanolamine N-methyltransferase
MQRRLDLDKATIEKAYARWAPVYDLVFGAVFSSGRHAAITAAEAHGGRILDVGVGTGLSLPEYASSSHVVGVDLSEPMLRKAQTRVCTGRLGHVNGLAVMDAQKLAFAARSFDVVVAQYVITAVPNPEATLNEFVRVLRPDGEIILVNHLGAESGSRYIFERAISPLARGLGWRPDFSWPRIARWADLRSDVELIERRRLPPLGHFSLIRFRCGRRPRAQTSQ